MKVPKDYLYATKGGAQQDHLGNPLNRVVEDYPGNWQMQPSEAANFLKFLSLLLFFILKTCPCSKSELLLSWDRKKRSWYVLDLYSIWYQRNRISLNMIPADPEHWQRRKAKQGLANNNCDTDQWMAGDKTGPFITFYRIRMVWQNKWVILMHA